MNLFKAFLELFKKKVNDTEDVQCRNCGCDPEVGMVDQDGKILGNLPDKKIVKKYYSKQKSKKVAEENKTIDLAVEVFKKKRIRKKKIKPNDNENQA